MLPNEVRDAVATEIGALKSFTTVSGGCINHGGKLTTANGAFFLKWNDAQKFPGMFAAEAKGLQILSQSKCVNTPSVVIHRNLDQYQFIVMEWIEQSRMSLDYWEVLGRHLAALHHQTSSQFGLDHSNFIGSLPQINRWTNEWPEFLIRERLEPQLDLLKASSRLRNQFESLYKKLPQIFPSERPSLVHGDLWRGNLLTNENGEPCLIDPAIYFGHREMELAFTRLFGGFDERFLNTYKGLFPLAPGFEERVDVYNLYPLLVHANLFGGHYLNEIEHILRRWA